MAVRPIRLYGDPVLRGKSKPVERITPEIHILVEDLIDTMKDANGIGLAAPQVGELVRVFVVDRGVIEEEGEPIVCINPKMLSQEGEQTGDEGCLSFPNYYEKVTRAETVRAEALDLNGERFEIEGSGLLARAILHEYDHLDGILFIDRMSKIRLRLIQGRLRRLKKSTEEALQKGEYA